MDVGKVSAHSEESFPGRRVDGDSVPTSGIFHPLLLDNHGLLDNIWSMRR